MNDGYFIGVIVYLVLSVTIVGLMPSDLYSGTSYSQQTEDNIRSTVSSGSEADTTTEQLNFLQKVLTFLFVSWTIQGIPALIGIGILLLNLLSIFIIIIWTYDKVRGIGT